MKRILLVGVVGLLLTVIAGASTLVVTQLYTGGSWVKKTKKTKGTFEIVDRNDVRVLLVHDDFSTPKGPDLKFVLSPLSAKEVKSKTALDGGLILGELQRRKGAQEYTIPKSADLDSYKSLLVHCEKYTKLWSAAPLVKVATSQAMQTNVAPPKE